jgi:transcriptional regulator with XRE-family HTH domain
MGLMLRRRREQKGLSLRALGEQSGVSYVTIAKIEAGTVSPTLATLEKLAGALELSLRDLFSPERAPRPTRRRRER